MKITYDKRVDALNVSLRPGVVSRTIEVAPEILLDVDKNEKPLYLEIIGASEKIGKRNFGRITIGKRIVPIGAAV